MPSTVVDDLKQPWKNRTRTDKDVTGAIELAYLRGVQAGREDTIAAVLKILRKWFFMSKDLRECVTEINALKD